MESTAFGMARDMIAGMETGEMRLSAARSIIKNNCLATDQVVEICKLLTLEPLKLSFAKEAYTRTVDAGNYYKLYNVLTTDDAKKALNEYMNARSFNN